MTHLIDLFLAADAGVLIGILIGFRFGKTITEAKFFTFGENDEARADPRF